MKAMILAVKVIEMAEKRIAAQRSPLPTQSAERLQKQKEIERPKRT